MTRPDRSRPDPKDCRKQLWSENYINYFRVLTLNRVVTVLMLNQVIEENDFGEKVKNFKIKAWKWIFILMEITINFETDFLSCIQSGSGYKQTWNRDKRRMQRIVKSRAKAVLSKQRRQISHNELRLLEVSSCGTKKRTRSKKYNV